MAMAVAPAIIVQADSGSEILAGVIGILGAVLGSIVAVLGSEIAATRNRRRDARSRTAALSFSIYQKISFIYSDTTAIRKSLRAGILAHAQEETNIIRTGRQIDERGNVVIRHNSISSYVLSWANAPSAVNFNTDETWAAKDISGVDLLNSMMSLDRGFNALRESCVKYSDMREVISRNIRVDDVDGIVVTMAGNKKEFLAHVAESNMLDNMLLELHEMSEEICVSAFAALKLLVEAEPRPFGKGTFELSDPDGDKVILGGLKKIMPSVVSPTASYR